MELLKKKVQNTWIFCNTKTKDVPLRTVIVVVRREKRNSQRAVHTVRADVRLDDDSRTAAKPCVVIVVVVIRAASCQACQAVHRDEPRTTGREPFRIGRERSTGHPVRVRRGNKRLHVPYRVRVEGNQGRGGGKKKRKEKKKKTKKHSKRRDERWRVNRTTEDAQFFLGFPINMSIHPGRAQRTSSVKSVTCQISTVPSLLSHAMWCAPAAAHKGGRPASSSRTCSATRSICRGNKKNIYI
jgi:hypothetical protein